MQDGLMEGSPVSSAIDVVSIVAVAAVVTPNLSSSCNKKCRCVYA